MNWDQLVATNGVHAEVNTPKYGGPQKVGVSYALRKLGEVSVGGVQYDGLTWSVLETDSGSVVITGLDDVSEVGVYYDFKNNTGESILDADGKPKATILTAQ